MHLHGLTPWDIDRRMSVKDFHLACEWVDAYYAAMTKESGSD